MVRDYIDKATALTGDYNRAIDALRVELSEKLKANVVGFDVHGRVHIYEPEFVAAIPGAEYAARTSDFYPWEVHAEADGGYFFALLTDEAKRELCHG